MFDYIMVGACTILTIGVLILLVQVMKLVPHVRMLDTVVIKLIQGEKIILRKVDDTTSRY